MVWREPRKGKVTEEEIKLGQSLISPIVSFTKGREKCGFPTGQPHRKLVSHESSLSKRPLAPGKTGEKVQTSQSKEGGKETFAFVRPTPEEGKILR